MYTTYKSSDEADVWIDGMYRDERQMKYGIVFKETGELIGSAGLRFHPENGEWAVGYNIRRDYWGKGIVFEAMTEIIKRARRRFDVKEIVGTFANDDPKSGRVMEKLGMTYREDSKKSLINLNAN